LDPTIGMEMQKTLPALIVSNDIANTRLGTVIICPITDAAGKEGVQHILIDPDEEDNNACGLEKESVINCTQIRVVDKSRIGERFGRLSSFRMAKVGAGMKITLGLS
jgi:mRNA interferase MazF